MPESQLSLVGRHAALARNTCYKSVVVAQPLQDSLAVRRRGAAGYGRPVALHVAAILPSARWGVEVCRVARR